MKIDNDNKTIGIFQQIPESDRLKTIGNDFNTILKQTLKSTSHKPTSDKKIRNKIISGNSPKPSIADRKGYPSGNIHIRRIKNVPEEKKLESATDSSFLRTRSWMKKIFSFARSTSKKDEYTRICGIRG